MLPVQGIEARNFAGPLNHDPFHRIGIESTGQTIGQIVDGTPLNCPSWLSRRN